MRCECVCVNTCRSCGATNLKRYATSKIRSCFCLQFRPKHDDVVSILVQGRSLLGSKMQRFLYVSVGERLVLDRESDFPCARIETTTKHMPMFMCTLTYPISC